MMKKSGHTCMTGRKGARYFCTDTLTTLGSAAMTRLKTR
jgi:hypothetical protein